MTKKLPGLRKSKKSEKVIGEVKKFKKLRHSVSSYNFTKLKHKRKKEITPEVAEVVDFQNILLGLYQKIAGLKNNRKTKLTEDEIIENDNIHDIETNIEVENNNIFYDFSKQLGMNPHILQHLKQKGNKKVSTIWPSSKIIHFDQLNDAVLYSNEFSDLSHGRLINSSSSSLTTSVVNQSLLFSNEINQTYKPIYNNGKLNWKANNINILSNTSGYIIEPFRPVPSSVRDVIQSMLPILANESSFTHETFQKETKQQPENYSKYGYNVPLNSFLYQIAQNSN